MNELAALSMIVGYCAALFILGYIGIRVDEKRREKEKERQPSLFEPNAEPHHSQEGLVASGH